ncbi:unnamed protein product [Rhodiola kirilowii]
MSTASYDEETSNKILRQVEFYFSDSNLPRDDFLRNLVERSSDGLVNLDVVCSFSRMRSCLGLGNLKARDVPDRIVNGVAEILRKSDVLKLSLDGKKIGRLRKLANPEKVLRQVDGRTVAASPLPYDAKIEVVQAFFGQYGKVNSIRLPKHALDKNCFCGTALIEFSSEEEAGDVLKLKTVYDGMEIELKPKKQFDIERNRSSSTEKKLSSKDFSYEKGLIVLFTIKRRVNRGPARKNISPMLASSELVQSQLNCYGNSNDVNVTEGIAEGDGHADKKSKKKKKHKIDNEDKAEEELLEIKSKNKKYVFEERESETAVECNVAAQQDNSAVLFKDNDAVAVQDLKDVFTRFGTIKFLDFDGNTEHGHVCFEEPDAALKACAAADLLGERGMIVKNSIALLEALTGEAEKEYWKLHVGKD